VVKLAAPKATCFANLPPAKTPHPVLSSTILIFKRSELEFLALDGFPLYACILSHSVGIYVAQAERCRKP
jgi:hypothetical protein